MPDKPFSPSSENNKAPIAACLGALFADRTRVLEIGSGTGQHAVHLGAELAHLTWLTSDLPAAHAGIRAWIEDAALPNVRAPIALDVDALPWPDLGFDAAFSANTAHIMSESSVHSMFAGVAAGLPPGGVFALYGPFRYGSRHTGPGNARFDRQLRAGAAHMGIRDAHALVAHARSLGLELAGDHPMPSDNRLLEWRAAPAPAGA